MLGKYQLVLRVRNRGRGRNVQILEELNVRVGKLPYKLEASISKLCVDYLCESPYLQLRGVRIMMLE